MQFGIGHPPPTHQLQSTCVGEGSRVPNLQTEFNYLDSFKSYGIFSDFVVPVVPMLSPWSPCHLRCPHIVPMSSPLSPHHPHSLQKVPMWFPWLWSLWSPPLIPTSSPHHLEGPHIIPNPPDTHSTHPHPLGAGGPKSEKNAIRFELIKIF